MPKKRGNGQGTVRKRGNTWTAIWTVGWKTLEDGTLQQVTKTKGGFATKTAALQFSANPEADRGKTPDLNFYWEIWSTTALLKLGNSKQTAYKIAKEKMKAILFIPVDQLTLKDVQDIIKKKAPTYYPAKDIKTLLSNLLKLAEAENKVAKNIADFIVLPDLNEKEIQPFNKQELHKMWQAYGAGDMFVGYLLLMIYTGMMPGELFTFQKDMIDWDACEIKGCGLKTKKRKETPMVFPNLIAPVLLDLCQQSKSKRGKVLCMNKDRFYDEFHTALSRIGIRDLAPYSCRHTTATALALGNIAPSVIQEVMRHTKFTTTQRYIHPDTAAALAAVNLMDKGTEKANIYNLNAPDLAVK